MHNGVDLAQYPIYAERKGLSENFGLRYLQAWGARAGRAPGMEKRMKLEA